MTSGGVLETGAANLKIYKFVRKRCNENKTVQDLGLQAGVPTVGFPGDWFAPGTRPHLHVPGGTGSGKVSVGGVF